MIVTEEEAKTKRCQESFGNSFLTSDGASMTIASGGPYGYVVQASPSHCIGSACMAWRWATEWVDGSTLQERTSTTHGYCGKAGKP